MGGNADVCVAASLPESTVETPHTDRPTETTEDVRKGEAIPAANNGKAVQTPKRHFHYYLFAGAALIVAMFLYFSKQGPTAPSPVQIDTGPGGWQAVDLSAFASGRHILIRADGPFRLRSDTTAPILINSVNAIDIGSLGRSNLEVKSAIDRPVHIEIAQATD